MEVLTLYSKKLKTIKSQLRLYLWNHLLSISIQTIHAHLIMCVLVGSVQFCLYNITLVH